MKILWGLEPFHQDSIRLKGMHALLKQIAGKKGLVLKVGFVATRTENEIALAFNIPIEERFTDYPHRLLKESLKKSKIVISDKDIVVEDCETISTTKAVDTLLTLAKKKQSELVALYTHSRRGLKRFLLGSFAETAVHRSQLNLLIAGPDTKFSAKLKTLFYMSDFSSENKNNLSRVINFAQITGAKLVVFYVPNLAYFWPKSESTPEIEKYRSSVEVIKEKFESESRKSKISCQVIIATKAVPILELALKTAKEVSADLFIVRAQTGALKTFIGGSVTRQILRSSPKPVLVLKG